MNTFAIIALVVVVIAGILLYAATRPDTFRVGQGSIEILESTPRKIGLKLDFMKPFEAHNTGEFILSPKGDSTDVTWAIYGPSPFMSKVMGLFMNIDRMVGQDFEKGLADLEAIVEQ
jgi:hypothetical protein